MCWLVGGVGGVGDDIVAGIVAGIVGGIGEWFGGEIGGWFGGWFGGCWLGEGARAVDICGGVWAGGGGTMVLFEERALSGEKDLGFEKRLLCLFVGKRALCEKRALFRVRWENNGRAA